MHMPPLMLITDNAANSQQIISVVTNACENGVRTVQLRQKNMHARELWQLANKLRQLTAEYRAFLTINGRLDIALAVNADGVHLSEKDLSPQVVKKLKPSLTVGVSTHSVESALRAQQEGADYVVFGPIFETPSKIAFGPPQGISRLEMVTQLLSIPVIAVGGISFEQAAACLAAGAYGIAAIGAFVQTNDMRATVNTFQKELDAY